MLRKLYKLKINYGLLQDVIIHFTLVLKQSLSSISPQGNHYLVDFVKPFCIWGFL